MFISKSIFQGLGPRRMLDSINGGGAGPRGIWLAQRSLVWHSFLHCTLEETLRQNPFCTCEKAPVSEGVMILFRAEYVIYHIVHNLFRTGYIICRAQWKMEMWASCSKEFQDPRGPSKHRPGGLFSISNQSFIQLQDGREVLTVTRY